MCISQTIHWDSRSADQITNSKGEGACKCAKLLQSCLTLCNPWTVARQAPLSMGFSRQGYWSGLPRPPPGDLPDPGIEPKSPGSPALAGGYFTSSPPGKPKVRVSVSYELEIAPLDKYTKAALLMLTRRQCKDNGWLYRKKWTKSLPKRQDVAKLVEEKDPEFSSSHRYTKITIIYRATVYGNDLKTSRKDFSITQDKKKEPQWDT